MIRLARARGIAIFACGLWAAAMPQWMFAQESATSGAGPSAAEIRIERALAEQLRTPLNYVEQPLSSVFAAISEEYGIPIQFDESALEQVAMTPETEVSIQVSGVSLKSALELIFRYVPDLTYMIDSEVLLVTTTEEEMIKRLVRVYRIDDLVATDSASVSAATQADYDRFSETIENCLADDGSWDGDLYGYVEALRPGMLVVAGPRQVHRQIVELLDELRAQRASIDAALEGNGGALLTRGVAIDPEAATTPAEQQVIRESLIQSVDWEGDVGEASDEVFLHVLPTRVIVRHRAGVVREVLQAVTNLDLIPRKQPVVQGSAGRSGVGTGIAPAGVPPAVQNNSGGGRRGGF
jgi:hypothetical protein